jgi:hypothetical protein
MQNATREKVTTAALQLLGLFLITCSACITYIAFNAACGHGRWIYQEILK